jgi:hypothetical protein
MREKNKKCGKKGIINKQEWRKKRNNRKWTKMFEWELVQHKRNKNFKSKVNNVRLKIFFIHFFTFCFLKEKSVIFVHGFTLPHFLIFQSYRFHLGIFVFISFRFYFFYLKIVTFKIAKNVVLKFLNPSIFNFILLCITIIHYFCHS